MIAKRDPPLDPVDLDQLEASFIPDIKAGFQDKDGNDSASFRSTSSMGDRTSL